MIQPITSPPAGRFNPRSSWHLRPMGWYFTTRRRRLLIRPVPIDAAGLHAILTTSGEPV
jgi:hypothetical protein